MQFAPAQGHKSSMNIVEVPSPIDLRLMSDALEWESKAMDRPFREDFFEAITKQLQNLNKPTLTILELGSGPGFLALYILNKLPEAKITLLDFSPAMHELARKRLSPFGGRAEFVERNFKEPNWTHGLATYDALVTVQAVHELRHKFYAEAFHRQVRRLLSKEGVYLVCDHHSGNGGLQNDQLYMSLEEQRLSLNSAGYEVADILIKGGRSLFHASYNC